MASNSERNKKANPKSIVNKSQRLSVAVHGMSELINTRLSPEALELCLRLIEAGAHPKVLADMVLQVLAVKENHEVEKIMDNN